MHIIISFDISRFNKILTVYNVKIKIGELSENVIDVLNLNGDTCDIIMWEDRFKYIHKHVCDFNSEDNFNKCISCIPEIISNPDYIAKHTTKNSLEFIKQIDELVIVVIRIKSKGNLAFRTAYPLKKEQLQNYIKSN